MDCPKCATALREVYTDPGVLLDRCGGCGGTWLDKGEVLHYTARPAHFARALQAGLPTANWAGCKCPRCAGDLSEIGVESLKIDRCGKCEGLWFDRGELEKFAGSGFARTSAARMARTQERPTAAGAIAMPKVPQLGLRAAGVLALLYGIVTLAVIVAVENGAPPGPSIAIGMGFVVVQYLLGPFLMDFFLRVAQSCAWDAELPGHLRAFLDRVCGEQGLTVPRIGIIDDGAPNAFTYGHHPGNARLVVTRGLLELLDEKEREAVVAHELGHVKHWDVVVMTIAGLAPLFLYYLYRTLIRLRGKKAEQARAVAIGAYVLYVFTQYLVLWLSRTREYHADRFAADVTRDPNALASALVKVAYGLAGTAPAEGKAADGRMVRALGIFDPQAALALTAASSSGGTFSRDSMLAAMQWDLWNPWAAYFELHSTHPLPARRLLHLAALSSRAGQTPLVTFDRKKPESYWDEFVVDVFVRALPVVGFLVALLGALAAGRRPELALAAGLIVAGFGSLMSSWFSYRAPDGHSEFKVSSLLRRIKVSPVRGVACTVRGTVVGRGVPGLIVSEDLVLRDDTGLIFLDYQQPLRFLEWWFGLFRVKELIGSVVTVTGWYRRGPIPYIEMLRIEREDGRTHSSWVPRLRWLFGIVLIASGIFVSRIGR